MGFDRFSSPIRLASNRLISGKFLWNFHFCSHRVILIFFFKKRLNVQISLVGYGVESVESFPTSKSFLTSQPIHRLRTVVFEFFTVWQEKILVYLGASWEVMMLQNIKMCVNLVFDTLLHSFRRWVAWILQFWNVGQVVDYLLNGPIQSMGRYFVVNKSERYGRSIYQIVSIWANFWAISTRFSTIASVSE